MWYVFAISREVKVLWQILKGFIYFFTFLAKLVMSLSWMNKYWCLVCSQLRIYWRWTIFICLYVPCVLNTRWYLSFHPACSKKSFPFLFRLRWVVSSLYTCLFSALIPLKYSGVYLFFCLLLFLSPFHFPSQGYLLLLKCSLIYHSIPSYSYFY